MHINIGQVSVFLEVTPLEENYQWGPTIHADCSLLYILIHLQMVWGWLAAMPRVILPVGMTPPPVDFPQAGGDQKSLFMGGGVVTCLLLWRCTPPMIQWTGVCQEKELTGEILAGKLGKQHVLITRGKRNLRLPHGGRELLLCAWPLQFSSIVLLTFCGRKNSNLKKEIPRREA